MKGRPSLPASAIAIALALAVSALVSTVARAQDSILPGYWETTDRSPVGVKTERRCITTRDVAKFMMGPSNHIYACTYPQETIGGGAIAFRGECIDRKGQRVQLSGRGVYTHTTLAMTADVTIPDRHPAFGKRLHRRPPAGRYLSGVG